MLSQRRGRSWWRWLNFSYRIKCHSSIDYLIWCLKGENFYTIHFILLTAFPTSFPYGKRFLSNWWTNALQHGSTVSSWRFCPQASLLVMFIDYHFFLDIVLLFSGHFALFWTTLRWHLFLSGTRRGDIIHGYYILDDDHNHFYFLFLYIYGYLTWYWIHSCYLWTYLIILNENNYMSECGYSCENSFEIYGDSWRYSVHLMVSYRCN